MWSYQPHPYPLSVLSRNGWRSFLTDFIFGILTVAWYVLMRAEQMTFRWLHDIERFVAPVAGDENVHSPSQDLPIDEEPPLVRSAYRTSRTRLLIPIKIDHPQAKSHFSR